MYAGFWKRFFAFIIDWAILFALMLLLYIALGIFTFYLTDWQSDTGINSINVLTALFYLSSFAVPILYWSFFEASSYQATPGKMALGIKVCDENGNRLKFTQSLGRNLGKIISNLTLYIGYVMAGFTVKRQALHDKMSGCLVIDKTANIDDLRPLPKASPLRIAATVFAALLPFFLLFALITALIVFLSFSYVKSFMDFNNAMQNLSMIKRMQTSYKLENGAYADRVGDLFSAGNEAVKAESSGKEDFSFSHDGDFSYKLVSGGVAAEYKRVPHYYLTLCYDAEKKCLSDDLEKLKDRDIVIASPEECCVEK